MENNKFYINNFFQKNTNQNRSVKYRIFFRHFIGEGYGEWAELDTNDVIKWPTINKGDGNYIYHKTVKENETEFVLNNKQNKYSDVGVEKSLFYAKNSRVNIDFRFDTIITIENKSITGSRDYLFSYAEPLEEEGMVKFLLRSFEHKLKKKSLPAGTYICQEGAFGYSLNNVDQGTNSSLINDATHLVHTNSTPFKTSRDDMFYDGDNINTQFLDDANQPYPRPSNEIKNEPNEFTQTLPQKYIDKIKDKNITTLNSLQRLDVELAFNKDQSENKTEIVHDMYNLRLSNDTIDYRYEKDPQYEYHQGPFSVGSNGISTENTIYHNNFRKIVSIPCFFFQDSHTFNEISKNYRGIRKLETEDTQYGTSQYDVFFKIN